MATLKIAGLEITVDKKPIKNLHLYVKAPDGHVMVSAPEAMADAAIERFVGLKMGWVKRQQAKFAGQPRQAQREHVSGETLYVWGRQYYLKTEYGPKNSLVLAGDRAVLTVRRASTAQQREKFVREWYRRLLKERISRVLPQWQEKTGLAASSWQTKYMVTRWGTCNHESGKIWLNLQLAKKTPECLEYVILHELAHLAEKGHGERFIAILDKHMPMWRAIREGLNEQTLDYMAKRG